MQEKTWYYEKWVGCHTSIPPSRYAKFCHNTGSPWITWFQSARSLVLLEKNFLLPKTQLKQHFFFPLVTHMKIIGLQNTLIDFVPIT